MQVQELLQQRKARGYEIASKGKITQDKGIWVVPSATNPRQSYKVQFTIYGAKCTCADFAERGIRCKHIFSVDYVIEKKLNKDGTTTTVITTKKMTYPQDWKNYTKAQCEEGTQFKVLLKDLVSNVPVKVRTGAGRPATPLNEALYCAIDKVYSMQSSRRAKSRYAEAVERQQITKAPNYNVINILLNDPELTPILRGLLHITAMPLKSVETKFSPDSTGFRTTQFNEYCKNKHNTKAEHKWIKCHAIIGNKTNIITDAIITDENVNDCPQLRPLVEETAKLGFDVREVSADKGYLSIDNYNAVQEVGGTAFIPFKKNITANSDSSLGNRARLWRKMFLYFQINQDDFLEHYHNRSNVESTFMAVKMKLGDCLKSKNFVSQVNETLCKLIAYNITVLISAMYELQIKPNFSIH